MKIFLVKKPDTLSDVKLLKILESSTIDSNRKLKLFKNRNEAIRRLISSLLIRRIIRDELNIPETNITFTYNKYGKPFLNESDFFHFNISHSGDWIVCVIDKHEIGVDIEKIQPIDLDIAKEFFSSQEYNYIMSKPFNERTYAFYEIWTLKESYLKAIGKGLSIPLKSFTIKKENDKFSLDNNNNYNFLNMNIEKDYILSICMNSNSVNFSVDFEKNYIEYTSLIK